MRLAFALLTVGLLSGCIGYRPDQRVVGRFEAPTGEAVVIQPDGRILYVSSAREELIGLVTVAKEEPLSIRVIAPDTSPLVGTKIVFSSDRRDITVEWPSWQRAGGTSTRPTAFRAK